MIQELNRQTLRILAKQINEELEELGKEQGVHFQMGGGSYVGKEATLKLKIELLNSDLPTQEEQDYDNLAPHLME